MFRKLLEWFLGNWVSMILALLLAITVWIVASLEVNPFEEQDITGPVEIDVIGLGPGLLITNDYPTTTRVRLQAQRETWLSLSNEDILVTADLSGLGAGVHQVELTYTINAQAILVAMNPQHIRFELEERYEREMPVQLDLEGQPTLSYAIQTPTINPALVSIQGPESRVERISEIRASTSIEGRRDTLRETLPLVALDASGNEIEDVIITPDTVDIVVPIIQEAGFREISVKVNAVGRPAPGYYVTSIDVTPQFITVQGDPEVLEAIQPYAETETIDLTNRTDDFTQEVRLILPSGVTALQGQSVSVLVTIAAQLSSRTVVDVPIQFENLDEDLVAVASPETVDVILSGPLSVLDALLPSQDIVIVVNVRDLGPGTYQLEVEVRILQDDILVESIFPAVIEVEITRETGQ